MTLHESANTAAFRQFEQNGWQTVAGLYHRFFSILTTQAIPALLDAAFGGLVATRETRLLDVASGPGYVAGAAALLGASAFGVDFSPAMTLLARSRYPELPFMAGDAEELPFADGSFDSVVTNFGLLHLGQPEKALAEAHRVLRPGGRVAFTVWAPPEESVAFGIVLRAIDAHGNRNVSLPPGPPFFRFSDPSESRRVLAETGFQPIQVVRVPQVWRLRSADDLSEAMESATVRTRGLLAAQSKESRLAIRESVRSEAKAYEKNGGLELPMPAMLASAVKP
jgi:ubiquinone/menaquinone biosynthesis C-methylase UbiE